MSYVRTKKRFFDKFGEFTKGKKAIDAFHLGSTTSIMGNYSSGRSLPNRTVGEEQIQGNQEISPNATTKANNVANKIETIQLIPQSANSIEYIKNFIKNLLIQSYL